jgi:tetratricopeptide (TPR) repeat protein
LIPLCHKDNRNFLRCTLLAHTFNVVLACFIVIYVGPPVFAQHASCHVGGSVGSVPVEILRRPVPIRSGIGLVHEKITTSSVRGQNFYDQGITYLYSYLWVEAGRSFNEALRADPNLPMAYVGLADVYVGLKDIQAARGALEKAQSLITLRGTDRERKRVEICARRLDFSEDGQSSQKFLAYRTAIQAALADYPNDPWFWILRGFADEGTPFGRGQGGGLDSIAYYLAALRVSPNNPVAHHYLAHSFENIGRVNEALQHSAAYSRLATSLPHAHHMHGHALRWSGQTEAAVLEFKRADELENAYYQSENIPPEYDWHHAHNLSLLAMSYQSLGRMKAADKAFREMFALPAQDEFSEFNRREWPEFLLNRGRAKEALDAAAVLISSRGQLGRFAGHIIAGRAHLALNQIDDAKTELSRAEQELVLDLRKAGTEPIHEGPVWGTLAEILRAEINLYERHEVEGAALMNGAQERLRSLPGPDNWSQTLFQLESMARVARAVGQWNLAETTAKRVIEHDPQYASGHYELGLVAEQRGDVTTAKREFTLAGRFWNTADLDLPERKVIYEKLARLAN